MKFELLRQFAKDNKIELDDHQIEQIERFADILIEKNKVMNLTAITDPDQIEIKHMIDSLEGVPIIKELTGKDFSLLDIGCGAGFPGIPLKIAFPENRFVLLDSLNKRINFVNDAAREIGLNNITGIAIRAEDFKERGKFDICTSRAVAGINVLLEYSMPFLKEGGYCLLYKSGEYAEELKSAANAIKILGGEFQCSYDIELPVNEGRRSLIVIKKIAETSDKYPRRAGKPSKSPL